MPAHAIPPSSPPPLLPPPLLPPPPPPPPPPPVSTPTAARAALLFPQPRLPRLTYKSAAISRAFSQRTLTRSDLPAMPTQPAPTPTPMQPSPAQPSPAQPSPTRTDHPPPPTEHPSATDRPHRRPFPKQTTPRNQSGGRIPSLLMSRPSSNRHDRPRATRTVYHATTASARAAALRASKSVPGAFHHDDSRARPSRSETDVGDLSRQRSFFGFRLRDHHQQPQHNPAPVDTDDMSDDLPVLKHPQHPPKHPVDVPHAEEHQGERVERESSIHRKHSHNLKHHKHLKQVNHVHGVTVPKQGKPVKNDKHVKHVKELKDLEHLKHLEEKKHPDQPLSAHDSPTNRPKRVTRIVVKRRVIRGSPLFRPATEEELDEYLAFDRFREMVSIPGTDVDIPPTTELPKPNDDRYDPDRDLCAICAGQLSAKKPTPRRSTMRRVSSLLSRTPCAGGVDSDTLNISELASMDEYKAVALFLREIRKHRKEMYISVQDRVNRPVERASSHWKKDYCRKMLGLHDMVHRSASADDPMLMQALLRQERLFANVRRRARDNSMLNERSRSELVLRAPGTDEMRKSDGEEEDDCHSLRILTAIEPVNPTEALDDAGSGEDDGHGGIRRARIRGAVEAGFLGRLRSFRRKPEQRVDQ